MHAYLYTYLHESLAERTLIHDIALGSLEGLIRLVNVLLERVLVILN